MKKITTVLVSALIFLSLFTKAQNSDNPWLVGFGTSFIDFRSTDPLFDKIYDFTDVDFIPAFSRLNVGANLNNSFALDFSWSFGPSSKKPGVIGRRMMSDFDISLKYLLANGYLLKTTSCFDPYLLAGPGMTKYGSESSFVINVGAGFNIWLIEGFGVYFQSVLNKASAEEVGDYFQHSFGLAVRLGIGNDADDDGIADKKDKCPNVAGLEYLMGCPDRDGDSIADGDDGCPDAKGTMVMRGCPDTDGDGIADREDECQNDKGTIATKGCPDKDGDQVADKDDACPDVAGLLQFKGCADTDGDGIMDPDDVCPNEKGDAGTKGCPDRDGDAVADKDDKCPDVKGLIANNGCPAMEEAKKVEVMKKISFAAKAIQFETGKDIIKPVSFSKLDTVVSIMKEYPFTKWSIEGHTDNVGKPDMNLDLSKRRAAAVKKYFMDKGVAGDRLASEGYGDTQPAADNKTAKGKATNRRVEIKLSE